MNKVTVEKSFYQPNKLSYNLILIGLSLNVYYIIRTLNVMDKTLDIGITILVNIFILLLLFLSSVRVKTYSRNWSFGVIGLGLLQIFRGFLFIPEEAALIKTNLLTVMILSGILLIGAGVYGSLQVYNQKLYKKENN